MEVVDGRWDLHLVLIIGRYQILACSDVAAAVRGDVVSTHVSVADYATKDLGVLMRLYYPTERAPPFFKLFRPRWEPSVSYAAGRAHFLFNFNERPWWFKLLAKILYTGQHIASFETIPASLDAPPASRGLPVIVFSHGLSGCRNMYSALCTSLAARASTTIT